MRQIRSGSFALALLIASGVYLTALAITAVALLATIPCQWGILPLPDLGLCAVSIWRRPTLPWAFMTGGMLVVAGVGAAAAHAAISSWRRTRAIVSALEASASEPSERLRRVAEAAGVDRVREVDVPQDVALCYGFRRPIVLVSETMVRRLAHDELLAVLAHEAAHVRRRDPLRLALLRCMSPFGVAVPALRPLIAHAVLTAEWAADRRAIRLVGLRAVASALHETLGQPPAVDPGLVNAPGFCLTRERVALLGTSDPPRIKIGTWAVAATLAATALAAYVIVAVLQALNVSSVQVMPLE